MLLPEIRRQLAEASQNRALESWQRRFMQAVARDGKFPASEADLASPDRAAQPTRTTATDGLWAQEPPPTARYLHAAIYDPLRARMIVFDGDNGSILTDVWALTFGPTPTWSQLSPTGTPPPGRYATTAIYDPTHDRMVVFGGLGASGALNDVWALSLAGTPAWTHLVPTGTPPSARYFHSAIYDPDLKSMVIFGGTNQITTFNDVFALSLAGTPSWDELTPSGLAPIERIFHTAIYDPLRTRMVVFAGQTSDGYVNEVWALRLAPDTSWTQLAPTGTPPESRYGHTAIYDAANDRMLVYAGGDTTSYIGDVWALSLAGATSWTQLAPTGTPPVARGAHTAIYDTQDQEMVVFAGSSTPDNLNDWWTLSLTASPAWTRLGPTLPRPPARGNHAAIYDPARTRMVVFGGHSFAGDLNDVWATGLNGATSWAQLTPTGTPPLARYGHTGIYDPVRDRLLVFGGWVGAGPANDVWALSLAGTPAWTQLAPTGTAPGVRYFLNAIYDPVRDRMLFFGGANASTELNDVWALSLPGTPAWTHLLPTGTPPTIRQASSTIYDPVRDRMLVFGGADDNVSFNEVWALSLPGTPAWTKLAPTGTLPPGRELQSAIYDPLRDRMVVFGGLGDVDVLNDTWALSLAGIPSWAKLAPSGILPQVQGGHTAIYYPTADRMVVFGGDAGGTVNDLYNLSWNLALDVPQSLAGSTVMLSPAYPNPTRGSVRIEFALPSAGSTTLRVYDLSGREIRTLVDGPIPAGAHSIRWDGRSASGVAVKPGLYFYSLRTAGKDVTRRVVLVR